MQRTSDQSRPVGGRVLRRASGPLAAMYRRLIGERPDLSDPRPEAHDPALVREARLVWHQRLVSEFRSVQIMTRFLTEVVNGGDPLDVYAGALELVLDEVRHTELCLAVCEALGASTSLPEPVALIDTDSFVRAPFEERALHTAIAMLAINETLSTAFIADLAARCEQPAIQRVLAATLADESDHHAFGWTYVEASLARFPPATRGDWRRLVEQVLRPHREFVQVTLSPLSRDERRLAAHPDEARVQLGLFSRTRQALVLEQALETLVPRLRALELA